MICTQKRIVCDADNCTRNVMLTNDSNAVVVAWAVNKGWLDQGSRHYCPQHARFHSRVGDLATKNAENAKGAKR